MKGQKDILSLVTEWADPKSDVLPCDVAEEMLRNAEDSGLPDDVVEECCQ